MKGAMRCFFRLSNLTKNSFCKPVIFTPSLSCCCLLHTSSSFFGSSIPYKVVDANRSLGQLHGHQKWSPTAHHWIHYGNALLEGEKDRQAQIQTEGSSGVVEGPSLKVKRKKLKGKRAVVRWLKFFRYKKKRDYQRMTDEEKLLYKLNKDDNGRKKPVPEEKGYPETHRSYYGTEKFSS